MPERHTIHRLTRDHGKLLVGNSLSVTSPQGRFADAASVDGPRLTNVEAHGKLLFYRWDLGHTVHVHRGPFGRFRRLRPPFPEPREAVRTRVVSKAGGFDSTGPTDCRIVSADEEAGIRDRLGPDPLRSDADPDRFRGRVNRSRAAIGSLLLNQSVVAGIGNVYRAELLFSLGIAPTRTGRELDATAIDALWDLMVEWLAIGVRYNRIITTDPVVVGRIRGRMRRHKRLLVYKKPCCTECGGGIETIALGGRPLYYCPSCQS